MCTAQFFYPTLMTSYWGLVEEIFWYTLVPLHCVAYLHTALGLNSLLTTAASRSVEFGVWHCIMQTHACLLQVCELFLRSPALLRNSSPRLVTVSSPPILNSSKTHHNAMNKLCLQVRMEGSARGTSRMVPSQMLHFGATCSLSHNVAEP
jgi:hypothetical protein